MKFVIKIFCWPTLFIMVHIELPTIIFTIFLVFIYVKKTYTLVYITTNHSNCPLLLQIDRSGLLLAAGHCLPVSSPRHCFPSLPPGLQYVSTQPHLQEPHHLVLLHHLHQLHSSHYQSVSPASRKAPVQEGGA